MFQALEVSLDLVRSLRRPLGRRRAGGDRAHSWRIAAGSADELRADLRVALAWGDVEDGDVAEAIELLDRVLAMLWRLTR